MLIDFTKSFTNPPSRRPVVPCIPTVEQTDRQTDEDSKHDKSNIRFSQLFWEYAKMINTREK